MESYSIKRKLNVLIITTIFCFIFIAPNYTLDSIICQKCLKEDRKCNIPECISGVVNCKPPDSVSISWEEIKIKDIYTT